MATYGNQDYSNARAFNLYGSTALRFLADNASGTLKADLAEGVDRAWQLPNKSGTFPIMGTFNVSLPVVTAGEYYRTAVTVSGIRAEDGLVITIQGDPLKNRGAVQEPAQLIAAKAGNGSITLTFASLGGTATAYQEIPVAYLAVR